MNLPYSLQNNTRCFGISHPGFSVNKIKNSAEIRQYSHRSFIHSLLYLYSWFRPQFLVMVVSLLFLAFPAFTFAHIGEVPLVYQGSIGQYDTTVVVMPTQAVPGFTDISVKIQNKETAIKAVSVVALKNAEALENATHILHLEAVAGENQLFAGRLQLTQVGHFNIAVTIEGEKGVFTKSVPFEAVNRSVVKVPLVYKILVFGTGIIIFFLTVILMGKIASEGFLPMGEMPSKKNKLYGVLAALCMLGIFSLVSFNNYKISTAAIEIVSNASTPTKPLKMEVVGDTVKKLSFELTPEALSYGKTRVPFKDQFTLIEDYVSDQLIPDHGKLVHLFIINLDYSAVAHLHPLRTHDDTFETVIPPLPPGTYLAYADITTLSGRAITFTTQVIIPEKSEKYTPSDKDDSWSEGVNSDYKIVLKNTAPLVINQLEEIQFEVVDRNNKSVGIIEYMGMLGHGALLKNDNLVFAHIHPVGTASMAAMMSVNTRESSTSMADMHHNHQMQSNHQQSEKEIVSSVMFPFIFYQKGTYNLWVQVKVDEKVVTQKFDLTVEAE